MLASTSFRLFGETVLSAQLPCCILSSAIDSCCLNPVKFPCRRLLTTQCASISTRSFRHFSRFSQGLAPPRVKSLPPWRMVFFGTDDYAVSHLKVLNDNRVAGDVRLVETLEVVVPHAKCAVCSYAKDAGLKIYEWPLSGTPANYDVGVVVSFGHLIPKRVIDVFPYGILNVHPSILPRWRGSSPIIHTVLNGDVETGISIMEIRPIHFDVGPLLLQAKFVVPENCTTLQLRDYLVEEGCILLMQALKDLPSLEKLEYEQNEYGVTYAHKLSPLNARVNWERQTSKDIDRQFRALSEMYGLRSQWKNHPVRLLDMVPPIEMQAKDIVDALDTAFPEQLMTVRPGFAYYHDIREILCIRCKEGWVGFRGIVLRKSMSAKCFYNGYLSRPEHRSTLFHSLPNDLEKLLFKMPSASASARLRMNGMMTSLSPYVYSPNTALINVSR